MRKEYATLRRRPLLTPVWLSALYAVLVLLAGFWALRAASTTLVVVVPVAASELPDLGLAALGEVRAAILAPVLGGADAAPGLRIDAVVVTQSAAAVGLAQPLARHLAVTLSTEPAHDPRGLAGRVLGAHRGGRVVVVVEATEVQALVAALSGADPAPGPRQALLLVAIPRFSRATVLALGLP